MGGKVADKRVVVQKKGNERFRNGLKLLYVLFFLLFIYIFFNQCKLRSGPFDIIDIVAPIVVILVVISLMLNSMPLALLTIIVCAILLYLGVVCPP